MRSYAVPVACVRLQFGALRLAALQVWVQPNERVTYSKAFCCSMAGCSIHSFAIRAALQGTHKLALSNTSWCRNAEVCALHSGDRQAGCTGGGAPVIYLGRDANNRNAGPQGRTLVHRVALWAKHCRERPAALRADGLNPRMNGPFMAVGAVL